LSEFLAKKDTEHSHSASEVPTPTMKLLLVVLAVAACSAAPVDIKQDGATKYLERFGYYNPYTFGSSVQTALMQFQEFAGLPVTGLLDEATKKQMSMPRCGRPDHDGVNAYSDTRWRKTHLTYKFLRYTQDLSQNVQRQAIVRGMNLWTEVTPLKFSETNGKSDITIGFHTGSHNDNSPFDGRGGVLAHAYFPENGRLHFDDAETWTTGTPQGTNLDWVTTHEFGHSLGLEHSQVKGSIMYPYYQGYHADMKLHYDDIRRIQSQYGAGDTNPTKAPATLKPNPNCKDTHDSCPYWKTYCNSNDYVKKHCLKSCGRC